MYALVILFDVMFIWSKYFFYAVIYIGNTHTNIYKNTDNE